MGDTEDLGTRRVVRQSGHDLGPDLSPGPGHQYLHRSTLRALVLVPEAVMSAMLSAALIRSMSASLGCARGETAVRPRRDVFRYSTQPDSAMFSANPRMNFSALRRASGDGATTPSGSVKAVGVVVVVDEVTAAATPG
ncbi:MAG: hypothetical protein ACXW2C_01935, partial [Acidimicrobiia bacterium]